MRRCAFLFMFLPIAAGFLRAQNLGEVTGVTIGTNPDGAQFMVDGQIYSMAQLFLWPAGSKHLIQFVGGPPPPDIAVSGASALVQLTPLHDIIYSFGGWAENTGLLQAGANPILTVTADPQVTKITAAVTILYRIELNFPSGAPTNSLPVCGGAPGNIAANVYAPGIVYVGATCVWGSASIYVPPGPLQLNAFPFPGFVFVGWLGSTGSASTYLTQITITGPMTIYPFFEVAKRVRFLTSPPGWPVVVDHALVPTLTNPNYSGQCPEHQALPPDAPATVAPLCFGDFDFTPSSSHQVAAPSPQFDLHGSPWVFTGWSGTNSIENGFYLVGSQTNLRDTVTANYAQGGRVAFVTSPPGLQLQVDGTTGWRQYNFVWAVGSTHQFSAQQQQTGSDTRIYIFQGWSNGGAASQSVTVDQTAVSRGVTLTANYHALSRLIVQSSPPGLSFQVDGQACQTPCYVDHPAGTVVPVSAPPSISFAANSRMDLAGWSDGASPSHAVTLNSDSMTLTANYMTRYRLGAVADPAAAAMFQFSPSSADSFYLQGTTVNIVEKDAPGYRFRRWDGALAGTWPTGSVVMAGPQSIIARMDKIPYIAPAGVMNAAGATPNSSVAPGSLVSIFGNNLAPQTGAAASSPLPQSLAGSTVTVEDRILALLFVSPQQINAILPPDLPEGEHTVTVHPDGMSDVNGSFTVARNAPGLLAQYVNGNAFAVATHAGGSPLSPSSAARRGETVTVYGTGFGPCRQDPVYGFPMPASPLDPLIDPVVISLGDFQPPVAWAGCAPNLLGLDSIQFAITSGMPSGVSVPLTVELNGRKSNTVLLPLQ